MDDPTRKNLPDDAETPPPDKTHKQDVQRGASEAEFTQVSNWRDEPKQYQYAIPPSDPLELTVEGRITYPVCFAGERRCPPEDCGGPHGYADFLEHISDPKDEERASLLRWAGGSFDPEKFDPAGVKFDSPARRLKWILES